MIAIAEANSESKHGGRRQLRRTSVCSAVNPRFCSFSRLIVDRCSLTVDEGQDPAGYPGDAAHTRRMGETGFRGVEEVFWAAARHRPMLGQLAFQYQAVTGAVDISTTPVVEYTYSSPANDSRITSMVYPDHTFSKAGIGTRPNGRTGRKTGTQIDN